MNRNEFYKELMKEYTFDSAKVRRNAKRSPAKIRAVRLRRAWYVPATAAAAAAAIVIGLFSFLYYRDTGVPTTGGLEERFSIAHNEIQSARMSFGRQKLYLSFNNTMSFRTMQDALNAVSDTGNIVIETVFVFGDGDKVKALSGADELDSLKNSGDDRIIGAKVEAPSELIGDLQTLPVVRLVEPETDDRNDDSFVPVAVLDTEDDSGFSESSAQSSQTEPVPEPDDSAGYITLNIPRVIEANFIGDNRFTAITDNSVALYEISKNSGDSGFGIVSVKEFSLSDYKKIPSLTGESFLISGYGTRGVTLLLADAKTQTLENIDISSLGELTFAFYDDINGRIVMRIGGGIYVANRSTLEVKKINVRQDAVILALNGDSLYYSADVLVRQESQLEAQTGVTYRAESGAGMTERQRKGVYKYDVPTGVSSELYMFEGALVGAERNADLSGFVVNINESDGGTTAQVFNAKTGTLTNEIEVTSWLTFYRNNPSLLTDGVAFYAVIDGNTLGEFTGEPSSPSERANMSGVFTLYEITDNSIKISKK